MLTPMIPTTDPYEAAELFQRCGWRLLHATPHDSGDRMAVVTLEGNTVMLGVAEPPFVSHEALPYLGAGTAFHCTVPADRLDAIRAAHAEASPTPVAEQAWGDRGFHVTLCGFRFMVMAESAD